MADPHFLVAVFLIKVEILQPDISIVNRIQLIKLFKKFPEFEFSDFFARKKAFKPPVWASKKAGLNLPSLFLFVNVVIKNIRIFFSDKFDQKICRPLGSKFIGADAQIVVFRRTPFVFTIGVVIVLSFPVVPLHHGDGIFSG